MRMMLRRCGSNLAAALICCGLGGTLATPAALAQNASPAEPADNIGHTRHTHHHNEKHPTEAPTPARFVTSRKSDIILPLPQEKEAFTFIVFGDRTGGPVDGVKILADAVRDANLFEPDLVMTVGDLINGYNDTPKWLEQMKEYKQIMGELRSPWFPVVGNHDVYWRGQGEKPKGEHDANYEMHFGPLWYAFEHKNSWFIALNSDETNPETGEKNFNKPENHRMSEEQFNWLKEVLEKAKDADHVFLFLHHPRWIGGNYGNQWDRVHELLKSAGNVTAVFAGHIHRMRYDPKDGIEYVTLATVGGGQSGKVPSVGYLHQYHVVTVRKQQVAMASIPVGEVMDVREITGAFVAECEAQSEQKPSFDSVLKLGPSGEVDQIVKVTVKNVTTRAMDVTLAPDSADSRWLASPDHDHGRIEPGQSLTLGFRVSRGPGSADASFRPIEIVLNAEVLMPGHRYALPEQRVDFPVDESSLPAPAVPAREMALRVDGDDAILVANKSFTLPQGPFTLEAWFNGDSFEGRTGLICKTQGSDYGMFVTDGRLAFSVFLGEAYASVRSKRDALKPGTWHHAAGVFDGSEVRLYLDGVLMGREPASGVRKTNELPLVIGADVDRDSSATSFFRGYVDAVRLSTGAAYSGDSFTPQRRLRPDSSTLLLSNMDGLFGRRIWGEAGSESSPRLLGEIVGRPLIVEAP